MNLILVGLGGAFGAVARYLLSGFVQARAGGSFPWGTLVVNVSGCFVMGLLAGLGEARGLMTPQMRALLVVGVLGGYTTFSAFGNETVGLAIERDLPGATMNVVLSVVLGVAAVWAGRALALALAGGRA
ncbi:MAG TPA: fluoride efflux transporter CrcB [Candidatus Polarisedimenticolia bacterium]|nr:fluoride efflux transporter CrcB [Candidatus Polarisedimenticolia bacterium]